MYVAVKGGERAIEASRALLAAARRGDPACAELTVDQLREQLALLVARVMAEGSLFDPELAALAIKQARGDAVEAAFLLRAYRTTLPRLASSEPLDTRSMRVDRRISAIFKDLPGGQILGPTYDYTQRLLDFALLHGDAAMPPPSADTVVTPAGAETPSALADLLRDGLVEDFVPGPGDPPPPDITRDPPSYPMPRSARLQMLARADEGWVLGLGYSTQRGYAYSHPFAGDVRHGWAEVELVPDELDFPIVVGEVELTQCEMVNQFVGSADALPQFTRGYGLSFGHAERRTMAMALVDRALRWDEFGEAPTSPAQAQEFVLPQGDSVEASGFVQHLKLPHYVTFESELELVRLLRREIEARAAGVEAEAAQAAASAPAQGGEVTA